LDIHLYLVELFEHGTVTQSPQARFRARARSLPRCAIELTVWRI
jgi:hypothetical protein